MSVGFVIALIQAFALITDYVDSFCFVLVRLMAVSKIILGLRWNPHLCVWVYVGHCTQVGQLCFAQVRCE